MKRAAHRMSKGSSATGRAARRALIGAAALTALFAGLSVAWSHGSQGAKSGARSEPKGAGDSTAFGRAIRASDATRTIKVEMSDAMRFSPAEIRIARGERVRIVVRNAGATLHEMVLGTRKELEQHAELMRRFPGMEHDEPYMAHVAPGATGEINWEFTQSGEFLYGCLIPGHFDAGMVGRIIVAK